MAEYLYSFSFKVSCRAGQHQTLRKRSLGYVAKIDHPIRGTDVTVDVAILDANGGLKGVVNFDRMSVAKMQAIKKLAPCFVLPAEDVTKSQSRIPELKSMEKIVLECVNSCESNRCMFACKFSRRQREHRRRPCVSCFRWSWGHIPISPPAKSRFGIAFSCEMCRIACVACGEASSIAMSKCGIYHAKTLLEKEKTERGVEDNNARMRQDGVAFIFASINLVMSIVIRTT